MNRPPKRAETQARDGDRLSGRRREAGGVNNIQPLKVSDHATSSDPAVQRQLDRLWSLSPGADTLGLERITRLLDRLGNPQHDLPPVLHVAGTNGKGSTCAFLRAAIDAAGLTAPVYSSPHLVRFKDRKSTSLNSCH